MGWNFEMNGLAKNINFLEKFNEDVANTLKKEMRTGANEVAKASRSLIPASAVSNWGAWTSSSDGRDLGFIGSWVKRGVSVQTERTRKSGITVGFGYRVVNKTPAGAIYELAGSRTKNALGRGINKNKPVARYPRTLFAAYYMAMPTAMTRIETAIEKAKREASA